MEPAYLLGIDVDAQLVSRARSNLKDLLQQEQIKKAFNTIAPASLAATATTVSTAALDASVATISPADKAESRRNDSTSDKTKSETQAAAAVSDNGDKSTNSAVGTSSPFATEMPLSFRLWKPPVQATMQLPKALGKATSGYVSLAFQCLCSPNAYRYLLYG